jgi:hypothetical protein
MRLTNANFIWIVHLTRNRKLANQDLKIQFKTKQLCFTVTQALFHCVPFLGYSEISAYFLFGRQEIYPALGYITFMNEKCVPSPPALCSFSSVTKLQQIFSFSLFPTLSYTSRYKNSSKTRVFANKIVYGQIRTKNI